MFPGSTVEVNPTWGINSQLGDLEKFGITDPLAFNIQGMEDSSIDALVGLNFISKSSRC